MEERRSVEASGKSIEEATERALAELGATKEEAEIQILAQGRRLLGWGSPEARVRVTLRPPLLEDETAQTARDILERLLSEMRVEAQVSARQPEGSEEESPLILDVQGRDLGVLIGRRGETLRSLQYVTRLTVSRKLSRWANIVVDVEGYKERRESSLTQLANRMAERALLLGQPVSLEPMLPHERRIIHLALRDREGVTTESVGEGDRRKVVIYPKS